MVEAKTRRKPPTFHHLPLNRAKKLKQTWVQNKKIKSKWKAEKRKQAHGDLAAEEKKDGNEVSTENKVDSIPNAQVTLAPGPSHDTQIPPRSSSSLRDLTREAYSPSSLHTYRSDPLKRRGRGGRIQGERRGQPNMKLRMGVMLEKIKQDFT